MEDFRNDPIIRLFVGPDPSRGRELVVGFQTASGKQSFGRIPLRMVEPLRESWEVLEILGVPQAGQFEVETISLGRPETYAVADLP